MPKKRSHGEIPLPLGWDMARDFDGKLYYIDHNSHQTTWIDPRDRLTKPASFADCVGNELPIGWEQAYDPLIGVYYIDHINQLTQVEDPHLSWRAYQEAMLKDYLTTASEELQAKKDTLDIKTRRLGIAEDEYQHLNSALSTTAMKSASSTSSLTSTGRYDPDLLKQDVSLAKLRVLRLRQELEQIRQEVNYKQEGIQTLSQVEQKLSSGNCYTIGEAQAIMNELRNIQRSLTCGEKERAALMQILARHKEDLTRLQTAESSPDVSTLSIPMEKFSTASQTDLSGELVPLGARLAEMARLRLQYDESRKDVQQIQRRLSELEESVEPGEVESDKDRLLLFQEKEQLLRELKSVCPKSRSPHEMNGIRLEIQRLEGDLCQAAEMAKRNISDRVRFHEEKQSLLHRLRDALNSMASLEGRLKSLSASTLSMSSSSSLASLSSSQASSKGSLSSLSFTDIYGAPSTQPDAVNMADLHRQMERVLQRTSLNTGYVPSNCDACEQPKFANNLLASSTSIVSRLIGSSNELPIGLTPAQIQLVASHQSLPSLSPRSSLSSVSPPVSPHELGPPPSYSTFMEYKLTKLNAVRDNGDVGKENTNTAQLEDSLASLSLLPRDRFEVTENIAGSYSALPPLSPISEYVPESQEDVGAPIQGSSSGTNTRSVSAAVSDDDESRESTTSQLSVAGDSGVFEASTNRARNEGEVKNHNETNIETAQIQIKLRYSVSDSEFHICIERARNLSALFVPENHKVSIKLALLPAVPNVNCQFCTKPIESNDKLTLGEHFSINVQLNKLFGKTLQINFYGISLSGYEHCLGCSQVSLADFKADSCTTRWYNILSFHFMQIDSQSTKDDTISEDDLLSDHDKAINCIPHHVKQESEISLATSSGRQTNLKEESSDESTIISSQTSTLTRAQDGEFHNDMEKWHQEWKSAPEALTESGDEDDKSSDGEEIYVEAEEDGIMEDALEQLQDAVVEIEDEPEIEMEDKSTNTECVFVQTRGHHYGKSAPQSKSAIVIKRSQTFSPSAVVNKTEYVCRLNRSDSDSSMPLYRKPLTSSSSSGQLTEGASSSSGAIFQRGSLERRSLRWKNTPSVPSPLQPSSPHSHKHIPAVTSIRTSMDLELDKQAQQFRLQALQEEIRRLKILKEQLETAKEAGDSERMNSLLDDERLQQLFQQMTPVNISLTQGKETLKMEKLLKKTSREIYKLRKSRTPRGKPDLISFKEKMSFFTHPPTMIPIIQDAPSQHVLREPSSNSPEKLSTVTRVLSCVPLEKKVTNKVVREREIESVQHVLPKNEIGNEKLKATDDQTPIKKKQEIVPPSSQLPPSQPYYAPGDNTVIEDDTVRSGPCDALVKDGISCNSRIEYVVHL